VEYINIVFSKRKNLIKKEEKNLHYYKNNHLLGALMADDHQLSCYTQPVSSHEASV